MPKSQQTKQQQKKVIIYGGNGFVGTHVAEVLADRACTVCLSRSGYKPIHLKDETWSKKVRWCKGDASQPDTQLLETADVVICLVGSAPKPTFSEASYANEVFANGTTNANAIQAAADAGVKRVVLLGAHMPGFLKSDRFAYARGKAIALEAAEAFSQTSDAHHAAVFQPGAIYGIRHQDDGSPINLQWFMRPLSRVLPRYFTSVYQLAERIADTALAPSTSLPRFSIISGSEI